MEFYSYPFKNLPFDLLLERQGMSIELMIPNFNKELKDLQALAKGGLVMGFGIGQTGAEYLLNRYPKRWQKRYVDRGYLNKDPVLLWTISHEGTSRWSEMKVAGLPLRDFDQVGFLEDAARHGLRHGVTVTQIMPDRRRSFITLAHPEREFTDVEVAGFQVKFNTWAVRMAQPKLELGDEAIEVLRYLREGLDYAEIAAELNISPSGVKQRVAKICDRMGVANKIQAVAIAQARGYLDA